MTESKDESLDDQTGKLAAIHRITSDLAGCSTVDEVLRLSYMQILSYLKPDMAVIYLRDNDCLISQGETPELPVFRKEAPDVKRIGQCLCGLAAKEKNIVISLDIHKDPRCTFDECKKAGLTSFAALPLMVDNTIIGVLGIGSFKTRDFSPLTDFLNTVSSCIALALQNCRLKKQLDGKADQLENENTLKSIFRAAPTGIGMVKDRIIVKANAKLSEITGYSKEELIGASARILYPDDDEFYYVGKEKYDQIRAKGTGTVETCWRRKDGKILDILLSSTPLDEKNLESGVTFTALDITIRKQSEKALKLSQERLKTVLDSMNAGIYVTDIDTHVILFMNQYMIKTFGKNSTGEICHKVFRNALYPCSHCSKDKLLTPDGCPSDVLPWQEKSPVTGKWYINNSRVIEWSDRRQVRLQIITDITELKLMQTQLNQAQKMEALGTLSGGIAHDFNNLLMGIQGQVSLMLLELDPSDTMYKRVTSIESYINSASDLTRQLLGLGKGKRLETKIININELIGKSISMFGRTRKDIRVNAKFQEPLPSIEADSSQLEQVLLNLFVNAGEAMPRGGDLILETSLTTLDPALCKSHSVSPGSYICLSVTDTGDGIAPEIIQKIFDPFFTTREFGRGTGLGLASVYRIIKNHNGVITVSSTKGQGTTFFIYLPVSGKRLSPEPEKTKAISKGSETLLLIDDEAMILRVGKTMLERLGYTVLTANSGKEALETLQQVNGTVDLVILDIIMPEIDGEKTFDKIQEQFPGMKVLLSSGYAINDLASEIIKRGAKGFIQKPFSIQIFSTKIRSVLDNNKN